MKRSFLISVLLLAVLGNIWADFEETYAEWSTMFGLDPNAGRSSFLILLIPAGGKYQSMGTAYTAMVEDLGFIDSNPAVSAYLNNTELMLFHNDWILDSNVESVAYTQRIDALGFGAAAKVLWIPFESTNTWGATEAQGSYTEGIFTLNGSYNLFRNYYYDGLSLGLNIKAGYRGISEALAQDNNGASLMADFGLISRLNLLKFYSSRERNFSLGLSVKNLGVEFIETPDPLPSSATLGLAYSPLRILTLAVDYSYPFYLNGEDAELPHWAFGLDMQVTPFLDLQSGFLLKVGKPRFTLGSSLNIRDFTVYANYTLDLTTQFRPVDRMSVALKIDLGDKGRMTLRDKVQELYLEGLEAYAQGQYLEALAFWEECIELDEEFLPAQEMIDTTRQSLELEEEMRELQTVE